MLDKVRNTSKRARVAASLRRTLVLPMLAAAGERLSALRVDTGGLLGPNSQADLAALGAMLRRRINLAHMERGVTFVDPAQTYVDVDVAIGPDTTLLPLTFLEGTTRIGAGCRIGPAARVVDTVVGDGSEVSFSVVLGSKLGRRVRVGPYARVRPGVVLEDDAYAGGFVELKNARVGRGSKVPHLAYVGDAEIGKGANLGAGVVTVNYDGRKKSKTVIRDGAFIGSDTMLVAPIEVGAGVERLIGADRHRALEPAHRAVAHNVLPRLQSPASRPGFF